MTAVVADLREAPPCEAGQRRPQALLLQDQATCPAACRWLAEEAEASRKPLQVPARPRPYVRPSHLAERAGAEARRRTQGMPQRWDEASFVPLVCAVLIRVRERWGKQQCRACAQHPSRA